MGSLTVSRNMKYSFIIPALNEEKIIGRTIKSIKRQKGFFEIIVVDNGSTDKTGKVAKDLGCRVVKERQKGISPARNKGAKIAKGEYVCFIDADGKLSENWLESIDNILKKKKVDVIVGANVIEYENIFKKIWFNGYHFISYLAVYFLKLFFNKIYFEGNNMAIRKDFLFKIGGFETVIVEGYWLSKKFRVAGGTSVFDPKIRIHYSSRGFDKAGYVKTIVYWTIAAIKKKKAINYSYKNKK